MTNEETIKQLIEENTALRSKLAEQKAVIDEHLAVIVEQKAINEALTAEIKNLKLMIFGKKSESSKSKSGSSTDSEPWRNDDEKEWKKKGQKRGSKGHGRKPQSKLPAEEVIHDFPEGTPSCPNCGQPFEEIASTEDSDEIDIEVKVIRKRHRRKKCVSVCKCEKTKIIATAPGPAKLIPKGLLSVNMWVHLLLEKFLWQRPLERTLSGLKLYGLELSKGTVTGGLRKIAPMLTPLYEKILERCRSAHHWHADETRWLVFLSNNVNANHRWFLWVFKSSDAVVFAIDPSRSRMVPAWFFGLLLDGKNNAFDTPESSRGILSVDGFKAYKNLGTMIAIALCWSHVRRAFKKVGDGWKKFKAWSDEWLLRIGELFYLNKIRISLEIGSIEYVKAQTALENAVTLFFGDCKTELSELGESDPRANPLSWATREMEALTVFVKYPEVPMDNNEAERIIRNPVVGRKNYYGSGSVWSGELTMMLFSIIETLRINGVNPKNFLTSYLTACAENGGRAPPDLTPFLPWNIADKSTDLTNLAAAS